MENRNTRLSDALLTPKKQAIEEIKKRRKNKELVKKVNDFLGGDIPAHFNQEEPILYLSRHLATPNYEALKFIEIGRPLGLPLVIGQDTKGIFVGNNEIKRGLGKLAVTKGVSRNLDEIIEYFTLVDFSTEQGKPLCEVKTKTGTPLIELHTRLLREIYPNIVKICDESDWIDRNHRNNLVKQYENMLALMTVYGVMFETYTESETNFVKNILKPSFENIEQKIGVRPLIVELISDEIEMTRNWESYPSVLYQFIKEEMVKIEENINVNKNTKFHSKVV